LFDLTLAALVRDALSLCRTRRFRRYAFLWFDERGANQSLQARNGSFAIAYLGAMFLRLYDDTFCRDSMVVQIAQTGTDFFIQRVAAFEIEAQVNRSGYLVDVLTACALRANRGKYDVIQRNLQVVGNVDGVYHLSHTGITLSGSAGNPPGRDHLLSG